MKDTYKTLAPSHNSCVETMLVVTPSDSADLPFVSPGIWQIGPGTVRVTTRGGDVVTLPALPDGTIGWYWPVFTTRVHATGTTATAVVVGTA